MTHDEHVARAMLLGMHYHDGNGFDGFYFKWRTDGTIDTQSYIDAETLEPLELYDEYYNINWKNLTRKSLAGIEFMKKGWQIK